MKDLRIELRWGLLFSLILMIWMYIEKTFLGWHDEHIGHQLRNHYFFILPLIYFVIYYIAIGKKKKHYYNGTLTWKRGVASGAVISAIVAALSPLTVYFNYHYVSPDYFQNMIVYQTEHTSMTKEGAKMFFSMKSFMIQEVGTDLSYGIIVSGIVSLFLREKPKKEKTS